MADETYEYKELKNSDDATSAFRRQMAIDAEYNARRTRAELDAIVSLRDVAPEHPFEIGAEVVNLTQQADDFRKRADDLRSLAGLKDSEYPYSTWLPQIQQLLGQEEEQLLRHADMHENAAAYGVDEEAMRYARLRAEARARAYAGLMDEFDAHKPKANRAARRAGAAHQTAEPPANT